MAESEFEKPSFLNPQKIRYESTAVDEDQMRIENQFPWIRRFVATAKPGDQASHEQGYFIKMLPEPPIFWGKPMSPEINTMEYPIDTVDSIVGLLKKRGIPQPSIDDICLYIQDRASSDPKDKPYNVPPGEPFISEDLKHLPQNELRQHIAEILRLGSPPNIAKIMRDRYEFYRSQFNVSIPDFVPEHHFFVGQDEHGDSHAYVIEKEIQSHTGIPRDFFANIYQTYMHSVRFFNEEIEGQLQLSIQTLRNGFVDDKEMVNFRNDVQNFCAVARILATQEGIAVDVAHPLFDNLIIQQDGHLRYIDTDKIFRFDTGHPREEWAEDYAHKTNDFVEFLDALKRIVADVKET